MKQIWLLALIAAWISGCDRGDSAVPVPAPPATAAAPLPSEAAPKKTAAVLVPAVTDMIVGMGAADRLVAISNFDSDRPEIAGLPRIGDERDVDWEKLRTIRPDLLIHQIAPERVPAGMKQLAGQLGIELVIVNTDRLENILASMRRVGELLGEVRKGADAADRLEARLAEVARRVGGREKVPALIILDDEGRFIAGADTFFEEILDRAGGRNVASDLKGYVGIDAEKLRSLRPRVILQLAPGLTPDRAETARKRLAEVADEADVWQFTGPLVMLPGNQVGDLAEGFAAALHPEAFAATTQPARGADAGAAP